MNLQRIHSFGSYTLIPERQALWRGDTPVRIGARAFDLLTALVEQAGEIVTKAELIARAWPSTIVDEANLKVNMAALRRLLESDDSNTPYIATVTGRGYRFVVPVHSTGAPARTLPSEQAVGQNNLPTSFTRIFGRADNIASIRHDLTESRLVSIVGPGGVGKTTVAIAVAEQMVPVARDGVWLVDLAVTRSPELAASVIGTTLGIATPAANMLEAVCGFLRDRDVLIVLDSCEHIIEAAAACATHILASTTAARILVTSREPLDVPGERVRRLPSLDMPPDVTILDAKQASSFPAVQLFVERATDKLETYVLTDAEAPIVAQICRRLDGLALAIELAAARIDEFGATGLLDQLNDCFPVLARRYAEPERHRTLSEALDWSYRLLGPEEARFLRVASVFAGPFSIDDISSIAGSPANETARILSRLAAKSLLSTDIDAAGVEYRLLETTRAYCLDYVNAGMKEGAYLLQRHAELVCEKLERGAREWALRSAHAWSAQYGRVLGDLRSALDWTHREPGHPALRIRLTVAGLLLWNHYSLNEECRAHASRAIEDLDVTGQTGTAADMQLKVWLGSATMFTAGLNQSAIQALQYAMGLAIQLGDHECHMRCLRALGLYQHLTGQHVAASTTFEAYSALASRVASPTAPEIDLQIAMSEYFLGRLVSARRKLEKLRANGSVDAAKAQPVRYLSDVNSQLNCALAMVEWLTGSPDTAVQRARETVAYAAKTDHHLSLSDALNVSCPVLFWSGGYDECRQHIEMFEELGSRHGMSTRRPVALFYGAALTCQTNPIAGLESLMDALEVFRAVGHMARMPYYLSFVADVQAKSGEIAKATTTVDEALGLAHAQSEGWCLPEVQRVKATIFQMMGKTAEATALLQKSISAAQETGGLWMQLRGAIDLASLLHQSKNVNAAYDVLLPVYSAFTEGFETPDVIVAGELLATLKPASASTKSRRARCSTPTPRDAQR